MSSTEPKTSGGIPLSFKGCFADFSSQVLDRLPPGFLGLMSPEAQRSVIEQAFFAGAKSFVAVSLHAEDLGADVQEGAQIIERMIQEIRDHEEAIWTILDQLDKGDDNGKAAD